MLNLERWYHVKKH